MKNRISKWLLVPLVASMLLPSAVASAENSTTTKTTADFKDLAGVDAALKAKIDALLSKGVFEGISEDSFGIDDNMTRAQFAKVLTLIYGVNVNDSVTASSFSDVKADDSANGWAIPYIEAAKKAGLLNGTGNDTFQPGGDVTLGQFATGLVRGLGVKPDTTGSPWYADAVKQAINKKILPEETDGSKLATRADLVVGAYGGQQAYVAIKKEEEANLGKEPEKDTNTTQPTAPTTSTPTIPVQLSAAKPTVSVSAGAVLSGTVVSLSTTTSGAAIYYTTDTTTPSASNGTAYSGPIVITNAVTIKAVAVKSGYITSNVLETSYTIQQAEAPTANVAAGEVVSGMTVTLSTTTSGATIYYTTDTTTPSATNGTAYSSPIVITSDVTIRAIAVKTGMTDSAVTNVSYTVQAPQYVEPVYLYAPRNFTYDDPADGSTTDTAQIIALENLPAGATKWMVSTTVDEPETPSAGTEFNGIDYTAGDDIDISEGKNWIAIAAADDDGNVVGFRALLHAESTSPSVVASLSQISSGDLYMITITFNPTVSTDLTSITDAKDLIASIIINPDSNPVTVDLDSATLNWDGGGSGGGFPGGGFPGGGSPGGSLPSMAMIALAHTPAYQVQAGDVVRVTFKNGIEIENCSTSVVASG
ncbi:S-layer family protein [Paenibacillus taihuensis]|uniref:S-layer family protein n=1 Tax=Paenibacillus taihuensis TaxID=1156355 RepID=A0A3D9S181_9BACL|nr:chitobiase/beta-hexosaminidase C-terminal domain-containing protein [Paenibacillus taihuensis]REE83901.1 S-layer family protein [Paenibacillus taihuensis]